MAENTAATRWRLGLSLALLTCLFWATLPVALKMSLEVLSPVTLTWFRFISAFALTLAWLAARGQLRIFRTLNRANWGWLGLAAAGLIGNYVLYLLGLKFTTPANAQLLIQAAPLLLALGGVYFFKESLGRGQALGFVAIAIGLAVFALEQRHAASAASNYLLGMGLIFIAAITWVVYALVQKRLHAVLKPQQLLVVIYAAASLVLWPFSQPSELLALDRSHAIAVAYCALNTVGAYAAFSEAMASWEASRVSAILALTPVLTVGFVALMAPLLPGHLSPETIGTMGWCGAILVLAGSLAASLLKPKAVAVAQR